MKLNTKVAYTCVLLSVISAASCTIALTRSDIPAEVKTETPTATQTPDTSAQPPILATPIAETIDRADPDAPLLAEGPWWIFSTAQGLWAVNPDGTGLTRVLDVEPLSIRQFAIAPQGGWVAFLSRRPKTYDITLHIIEFPWPGKIIEKSLTAGLIEPVGTVEYGGSWEAIRAMIENQSMAFSPDGERLAFMGAIDGPTSDLYVYSRLAMAETRLTDGPSQAYGPVWSPDGKYILHAGTHNFGTGAGHITEGFWVARSDDSGIITISDLSGRKEQNVIGWIDNRTFVVYASYADCGEQNLRTFNIETKESRVLWESAFQRIAFDPVEAVALLGLIYAHKSERCNPENNFGLYLVRNDGTPPFQVLGDKISWIIWSENANRFLVEADFGILAVDAMGQYIDLDAPAGAMSFPAVAPDTNDLAWIGDGLWIGSWLGSIENPPIKIFNQPTHNATWDPSGEYVLFFSDAGLYVAQKPAYTPILIAEELDNRDEFSGWVIP